MFLILLAFPSVISSFSFPSDELNTFTVSPSQPLKLSMGEASSQFLLSISPCGIIHWKLFKMNRDSSEEGELIAGEEGEGRMTFYSSKLNGVDLLLVVSSSSSSSSSSSNSSVDIIHSSSQSSLDEIYPSLPSDSRVFISFEANSSKLSVDALVHWKVSRSIKSYPNPSRYRFCILSSTRQFDSSLSCPSSSSFSENIQCVDTRNQMEIKDLKPGRSYFITVFIRDSRHATISSYDTIQVTVPGERKERSIPLLMEGNLNHLEIPAGRGNSLSYLFQSKGQTAKRALLTVFSCSGYIRISVWRGKKLLKRSEAFTSFRRFAILNGNGKLRIEIVNDENRPSPVRIWIGKGNGDSPYASLPEDTSVRVIRRGCDWADIQWFRSSDPNDEYCVYERKETSNLLDQVVGKMENDCSNDIPHLSPLSSLIGCYSHKGNTSEDTIGILQTTVTGLPIDSTVRLDIVVRPSNRSIAQSLPYRTLWVRTDSSC
ncbi:ndnf-1 [Pristionchus pacificus]|uniref:Ndnf-1 n=1 Tax=Pristionchus pacificus TaxID=54126 RepID=A0A2A6BZ72_PRIPA|nr:ndnf-1 [Pristionchus pacificus]|eukprot:PDM71073.1 ndnf-1 [Pristionchus pacificus]